MHYDVLIVTPWSFPDSNGVSYVVSCQESIFKLLNLKVCTLSGSIGLDNEEYKFLHTPPRRLTLNAKNILKAFLSSNTFGVIIIHTIHTWCLNSILSQDGLIYNQIIYWSHGTSVASYWNIKPITLIPRLLLGFRDLCYLAIKSGSLSCLVAPYNASFRQFDQRSLDQYLFRLLSKTICIVENYSNINAKAQITRQSSSGIRFAIVGPITNEKGFNEFSSFIRCLNQVSMLEHYEIIVTSPEKINPQNCSKLVQSVLQAGGRIVYSPNNESVNNVLLTSDVYVSLSHTEYYSIVQANAMAIGMPVISRLSGLNRVINKYNSLCTYHNEKTLISATDRAVSILYDRRKSNSVRPEIYDPSTKAKMKIIDLIKTISGKSNAS